MKRLAMTGMVAILSLSACGPNDSSAPTRTTAPEGEAARAPAPPPPPPVVASAHRDLSTLKACEIVPPHEIVPIVGGKLLNEPPGGFANCVYVLEVEGNTESYRLAFSEPRLYEAMLEAQSDAEKGERLTGLWDEAYVQPRADGNGSSVIAVRRGDVALEVSGDRREPVIAIARLAASRIN